MALFQSQGLAIDLGTANTLVMYNDKIIYDQPSIIAVDQITGELKALGKKALLMHEKTHQAVKTIVPMTNGVISNFLAANVMIKGIFKTLFPSSSFFRSIGNVIISIPGGATEVEKRAVRDTAERAGLKNLYLLKEPMAAAMGLGLKINKPEGSFIIDIGGGTTEIAILSLSGIVTSQSLKTGGVSMDKEICDYIRKNYNLLIGERTAEKLKVAVGLTPEKASHPSNDINVTGRDMLTGLPKRISIPQEGIINSLNKMMSGIEDAVIKTLELCPPELASDIYETGIYLTGGGSSLKGLKQRLEKRTKLPVHTDDENLFSVVKGAGHMLKNIDKMKHVMQK